MTNVIRTFTWKGNPEHCASTLCTNPPLPGRSVCEQCEDRWRKPVGSCDVLGCCSQRKPGQPYCEGHFRIYHALA